jgi:hypothetical protein
VENLIGFEMLRHQNNLEVLLGDLECRYGTDHPIPHDIRAALPKATQLPTKASKAIFPGQKSGTGRQARKFATAST